MGSGGTLQATYQTLVHGAIYVNGTYSSVSIHVIPS